MASQSNEGKRLLASTLDKIAKESPERAWISSPRDDNDLSKGFIDITFRQLSNAVNHASHWLDSVLGVPNSEFEGFAYEGPPDARLAIIALAAVKTRRKLLLPFTLAPDAVKGYLLDQTKCTAFIFAQTSRVSVEKILSTRPLVNGVVAPSLHEWITDKEATLYPYDRTWEESKKDPWIIFHTSGTTGLPKPITFTNEMMTVYDLAATFPDAGETTQASSHKDRRVYSTIPMFHQVGMVGALQGTIWLGSTVVIGPSTKPPSPTISDQVLQYGNLDGFVAPPLLIKALCRDPASLQRLRNLKVIQWAGAPLEGAIGNLLKDHVQMSPAFGTTESGPYLTLICDDPEDWEYYRFREGQGIKFEKQAENLFELVFEKSADARWQQIFLLHPELDRYPTKDLFKKHPTKEGLWLYSGRADDVVILSNGDGLQASALEEIIAKDPNIHAALVGGTGRAKPFVVVELSTPDAATAQDLDTVVSNIWPAIEAANETCSEFARIPKQLVIIANSSKKLPRSGKGTVLRRETFELYKSEIDAAYESLNG